MRICHFFILYIGMNYVCPRCGNADSRYIGYKNGTPYCRKCIGFSGRLATPNDSPTHHAKLVVPYQLSEEQQVISERIVCAISEGKNVLVNAVCGSGKTELVFEVIKQSLIKGQQVGFVIPRRDVVIEIYRRLEKVFPHNEVIAVYGGNNEKLRGDIIVLTSHQLHRYPHYFDLLIMDEIDAYPFANNDVLLAMFKNSCRGRFIMMSATISNAEIAKFKKSGGQVVHLDSRYHGHPLPVPVIVLRMGILKYFYLIRKVRELVQENKPVFIFVPSISLCEDLFLFLSKWVRGGAYVHSRCPNRQETIDAFKDKKHKYLVTTAVLERGVTVAHLQVIVFESDNRIYTTSALIQIAGRVGRKQDAPTGEVVFLADRRTQAMEDAIAEIQAKNNKMPDMLSGHP